MKKALCLLTAMVLVSAILIGCRNGSDVTEQLARETGSAPTAEAVAATEAPKAAPTEAPKSVPTEAPKAVPTEGPMAVPKAGSMELPMECAPGGMLDDVATVSTCNTQAVQQVRSLSFDGEFNLMAIFPVEGVGTPPGMPPGQGIMRLSGAAVLPEDKFRFQISMSPEGQEIEMSGIIAGGDAYMQDPESKLWSKGAPPDSIQVMQLVGLIHQPGDAMGTLKSR